MFLEEYNPDKMAMKKLLEEKKFNDQLAKNRQRHEVRSVSNAEYRSYQLEKNQPGLVSSTQTSGMTVDERRTEEEWRGEVIIQCFSNYSVSMSTYDSCITPWQSLSFIL